MDEAAARHAVSFLYLGLHGPAPDLPPEARAVLFPARDAARVSVRLVSTARHTRLGMSAVCDGRARFVTDSRRRGLSDAVAWTPPGGLSRTDLPPAQRLRQTLELGPETTRCRLQVQPSGRPGHEVTLRREDLARPSLDALDRPPGPCLVAAVPVHDRLARVFHAHRPLDQTCPQPFGRTQLLPSGADALNAKIEALTGARIWEAALRAGDPETPLDWSNAPALDLIYVSYLNLNADFSKFLLARMLAFHAARGTVVRILVPDRMVTRTERLLFEGLAVRYPTVQMQLYSVPPTVGPGIDNHLGRFHRMSHVKLFATVSAVPGRSVAMVGGRNWHDGFIFRAPLDLSAWPFLHQYDPESLRFAGGFSAYVDFEIALHDDAAVRSIVGQMAGYWHRDHDSQRLWAPQADARPPAGSARGPLVRHFLSVPYVDGHAQEALFVELIDAAGRRIDISSPYLNLTSALDAAFRRARARGVSVQVVTTVRVREATDIFATALNRQFANDHADWVGFFDYDPEPRLLHSKLLVFDGRLAVVTSTNLNQRSFWHDTENGFLFLDPVLSARIIALIESYIALGERVEPGQPIPPLIRQLFRWQFMARNF